MKKFTKYNKVLAVVILVGFMSACTYHPSSKVKNVQMVVEPDPVSLRIADAVDKVSASLETLAKVEQARTPNASVSSIPNAPIELKRTVSVEWTGPIEPIAKRLAARAGYSFNVNGKKPPVPVIVNIVSFQEQIVEVLRNIGLQAGKRADIIIDTENRVVEVSYAPINAG